MLKTTLGLIMAIVMLLAGCSNSNQQPKNDSSEEMQIVTESDSLSNDLSTASDSVNQKVNDLQSTLDNLNN